jgi:hypothetical protein
MGIFIPYQVYQVWIQGKPPEVDLAYFQVRVDKECIVIAWGQKCAYCVQQNAPCLQGVAPQAAQAAAEFAEYVFQEQQARAGSPRTDYNFGFAVE